MSCELTKFTNRNYLSDPIDMAEPEGWEYYESSVDGFTLEEANRYAAEVKQLFPNAYVEVEERECYDVVFNDGEKSDRKGFNSFSETYCQDYIDTYNGTNESYFADYKGGMVSIVNKEGDVIYEEEVY